MTQSFSMRKIPVTISENNNDFQTKITDKLQILELSNSIDKWENKILFSENGYYSLKGKDAREKKKKYIKELEDFINLEISKINFENEISRTEVQIIKQQKIKAIEKQMEEYALQQEKEWGDRVLEESLESIKKRAVLYKNNPEIIMNSYKNAMTVLNIMSEKDNWEYKTKLAKKEEFESQFYLGIINSFISEKDVKASIYYEEWKEKIKVKEKDKLETAIEELRQNVTAYNWAIELFSYDLSDEENEKEIKGVEDKDIRLKIKNILADLKSDKQKLKEEEEKERNENNWLEITEIMQREPDKGLLYIDYTLSAESQKNKKEYIKKIRKDGYISTDKDKFLENLRQIYENKEEYKQKSISDLRNVLSEADYKIIEELRNQDEDEYNLFVSDYEYIEKEFQTKQINSSDEIYNFVKSIISMRNMVKKEKNKSLDIETRNRIIKTSLEKYCSVNNKEE